MAISLKKMGANETILNISGKQILISYETPVAAYIHGVFYKTSYKWSSTTSRHINKYLGSIDAEEKPQEFFDNLLK